MRKATDTTLRYLALLQHIPARPHSISARELQHKLRAQDREYEVDIRTIQRDLQMLAAKFPLVDEADEQGGRARRWCWRGKNAFLQIPAMDTSTALAFALAAEHLPHLMPPADVRALQMYFAHAEEVIRRGKLRKWREKTCIITRGPKLTPPPVRAEIREAAYRALLESRQLQAEYRAREGKARRRVLHPLGLVIRDGFAYLVAMENEYANANHYALHRMRSAALLDARARELRDFNLARYVTEEQSFSYPHSSGRINLRALFDAGAAQHLLEAKLSREQKVTAREDGKYLIEARVADTAELRWWLRGFGALVEVLAPAELRAEFAEMAGELGRVYMR